MIDNCTKCGDCSNESVCCKKFDSDAYLAGQKLSITLFCCDFIPKAHVWTPGVRDFLKGDSND